MLGGMAQIKLPEIITEYVRKINRLGWTVHPSLKKAGRIHELEAWLTLTGLTAHLELKLLYSTLGGVPCENTDILNLLHLLPDYYLMCPEDIAMIYQAQQKNPIWRKTLLPVFATGGSDYLAIEINANSKEFGQVFDYTMGYAPTSIFDNLAVMFSAYSKRLM